MVHLLDVAVTVHHKTVTAKMVLHIEMHDIRYGLGLHITKLAKLCIGCTREAVLLTKFAQERGGNDSAYAFLPKNMSSCLLV